MMTGGTRRYNWSNWKLVLSTLALGVALMVADAPIGRAAPAPVPVQVVGTSPTTTDDLNSVISVGSTATSMVSASPGRQAIILQNLSTQSVCCSKSNAVVCPPVASSTTGSFVLKASTVANDGSGGTLTFSQYSGTIYCIVAASTSLVSVISFAR